MPNKSIKWERVYRALRRKNMSKAKAAAISNAMYNRKKRSAAAKRGARKRR